MELAAQRPLYRLELAPDAAHALLELLPPQLLAPLDVRDLHAQRLDELLHADVVLGERHKVVDVPQHILLLAPHRPAPLGRLLPLG